MSDYYYICGDPTVLESCTVDTTIQITDMVHADLDRNGRVIGVERIGNGLVDFEDLVELLKIVTVSKT